MLRVKRDSRTRKILIEELQRLQEERKLSQEDLSIIFNISQATVSRLLADNRG